MVDLRPISLCTVVYKVISRVLVARLKPWLDKVVSPTQSAFVPERLISDNIIIAHEVVHGLRTHRVISKEFIAIKTDMSKAYDRIEWRYMEKLLTVMGFEKNFVDWIMYCVTSVTYSVLINGEEKGSITPKRGLRQGDPLSPFLFDLCTEGLSHLLNKAESIGAIEGIKFSEEGPAIHHLLFADDSLLMVKATDEQCTEIRKILRVYEENSGQMISLAKSSITFGGRIEMSRKVKIKEILGIEPEGGTGKYLGLPECFSGSKVEMLHYIQEKMKSRFHGWYGRFLSAGGKDILLKTVAMAMPVFAMSVFNSQRPLEGKSKIHWLAWEKLVLGKDQGGMGFRDIENFNQALLAKQGWRLLMHPDSLCAQVLRSRYYPNGSFMKASMGSRPSYAWRSILFGQQLLVKGLRRTIGSGQDTYVWLDKRLFRDSPVAPLRKPILFDVDLKVSDLINPQTKFWDRGKLEENFFPPDIELILKQKPVLEEVDDYEWVHTHWGGYTVKSGYWLVSRLEYSDVQKECLAQPSNHGLLGKVWKVKTAPKIRIFMWKSLSNALVVNDGKEYSAIDTVAKVVEDSSHWFEAQKGRDEEVESENREMRARDRWEAPKAESMRSHHVEKVIFEVESADLFGAVTKPKAWPAYRYQGTELRKALVGVQGWDFSVVSAKSNRCAHAIAQSVTKEKRHQSYVAMGNPQWLRDLFEADRQRLG
ncbi:uncharacterized protein LOC103829494 [Brassica rapa]|nr:uncharacterized protein LOC103829494 [Brassica rapa]